MCLPDFMYTVCVHVSEEACRSLGASDSLELGLLQAAVKLSVVGVGE